ncbi:hypothetical protein [Cedratvirus kamchatka]|uniref:Uncharacterized protein n=1 Tax=Cedratvirus kamchatka TaxID=2716914 RepID=A0A6G8MYV0_9VIRU|nr:hypothetical protein [Cedratvirus kamchatka]WIL04047.1 hypothetical protein Clen_117 [Cedratvirus lena]WIL04659.1 hypothetical protein Cduv_179 [Cedratvirus duvanny]
MAHKNKEDMFKKCGPQAQCEERLCNKDKAVRNLEAFSVDTCLFSFKPRLLTVDPCYKGRDENVFTCLDDAILSLRRNRGGYVIKLSPGTHRLSKNVELTVDNLSIIGDTSPVKGVPYINGARFSSTLIDIVPRYDSRIGKGPFRVTINSRKIKVSGDCDPDFSSIREGDEIGFLFSDREEGEGEIRRFRVSSAKGNTITLAEDFGLGRDLFVGEGFFIYPNTRIETICPRKIYVTGILEFAGITFDTVIPFVVGAGIYTSFRNCVFEGVIFLFGQTITSIPNVTTGSFLWTATAWGQMAFQGVLGVRARMIFNGNVGATVWGSVFSLCRIGGGAINGGECHFDDCDFFLNEIAIRLSSGASAHVPGARFIENIVAVNGFYNSTLSSEAGNVFGLSALIGDRPEFINNRLTFGAEWATIFNVSNLILTKALEDPYIRLDGRIRQNPSENPEDALGNAGSFVADKPNPYAGIE